MIKNQLAQSHTENILLLSHEKGFIFIPIVQNLIINIMTKNILAYNFNKANKARFKNI